jgi:hypothetical protein
MSYASDRTSPDAAVSGTQGLRSNKLLRLFSAPRLRAPSVTLEGGIVIMSLPGFGGHLDVSPLFSLIALFRHDDSRSLDKGLWFAEGDLFAARFYSHFLALQIKAREIGLLGPDQGSYIVS